MQIQAILFGIGTPHFLSNNITGFDEIKGYEDYGGDSCHNN